MVKPRKKPEEETVQIGYSYVFNDIPFIEDCFASIKSGSPTLLDVGKGSTITCLDHLLESIIRDGAGFSGSKSSRSVNPLIYTYLSDPELDLETPLCTGKITNSDYSHMISCIPKIIESYSALRGFNEPLSNPNGSKISRSEKTGKTVPFTDPAFNRTISEIQSIITRYPHHLKQKSCRNRSMERMMTCFDAVISQYNNWRILDLDELPEDFLDGAECENLYKMGSVVPCYEKLVQLALYNTKSEKHTTTTAYANTLLTQMLKTGRFDSRIIQESANCSSSSSIKYPSCFAMMLDHARHGVSAPFKILNIITEKFTYGGGIDTVSLTSPFYGERCLGRKPTGSYIPVNCLDLMFESTVLSQHFPSSESESEIKLNNVSQPSDNNAFRDLRGLLLSQTKYLENPCSLIDTVYNSATTGTKSRKVLTTILGLNSLNSDAAFDRFEELTRKTCTSKMFGTSHEVNIFDFLIERNLPLISLIESGYGYSILPLLNRKNCVSIVTGEKINCLEKVASEILMHPGNVLGHKIIDAVFTLQSSMKTTTLQSLEKSGRITADECEHLHTPGIVVPSRGREQVIDDIIVQSLSKTMESNPGQINVNVSYSDGSLHGVLSRRVTHKLDDLITVLDMGYKSSIYGGAMMDFVSYLASTEHSFGKVPEKTAVRIINTFPRQLYNDLTFDRVSPMLRTWFDRYGDDTKILIRDNFTNYLMGSGTYPGGDSFRNATDKLFQSQKDPRFKYILGVATAARSTAVMSFGNYIKAIPEDKPDKPFTYEPTLENRTKYDVSCMKDVNANQPYTGNYSFVQDLIDNPEDATTMRPDPFGIVGSYKVTPGGSTWTEGRLYRYSNTLSYLLDGGTVYSPYVEGEHGKTTVGLRKHLPKLLVSEPYGSRKDKTTATPKLTFHPNRPYEMKYDQYIMKKPGGNVVNDVLVTLEYYDDATKSRIDWMTKQFGFRDILTSLPKKMLRKLQEIDPSLFGLIQLVTLHELAESKGGDTYVLNISNKKMDLARISSCNAWDSHSCMRIGHNVALNRSFGGYSTTVHSYIDFGSYVAYLTKESPYEPRWFARLLMHQCDNDNEHYLSVQSACSHYDIGENYHKHWDIVHDAVQIILADRGVNATCNGDCYYNWYNKRDKKGNHYTDYTDTSGCTEYKKDDAKYKNILSMRTGQDKDSAPFVQKISDTF